MSSLEEEIDKFRFEEEAIVISKAEEEADEYSRSEERRVGKECA